MIIRWKLAFLALIGLLLNSVQSLKDIHTEIDEPLDVTGSLIALATENDESSSKINMSINPGCMYNNCTLVSGIQVSIINVTVFDDPKKEVEQHWIWSVIGRPTVQAAITPPDAISRIEWPHIFDTTDIAWAINYDRSPFYSGAVMLMNLIEFDDPHDAVDLAKSPYDPVIYPVVNFKWSREIIEQTDERIAVRFIGTNYTSLHNDTSLTGKVNLTISAYSNEGFGRWLPHLSHSHETCQVDIQLQGLVSKSGFNNSRYALELYLVSESNRDIAVTRQISTTLDDEHTPGIFKTEELVLPGGDGNSSDHQSYLQWRPVVYTTMARDLSESTGVTVSNTKDAEFDDTMQKSMLYILYGNELKKYLFKKVNVTFGSPEDGFYKKTKYNAWTFTFGVGEPIRNGLSPIIILAITVMLGALIIVFTTAGIVCVVKKWKKRAEENSNSNIGGQANSSVSYQQM